MAMTKGAKDVNHGRGPTGCTHSHTHTLTHAHRLACTHRCTHTDTHTLAHECVHAHTCMHTYAFCMLVLTHTHAHTHSASSPRPLRVQGLTRFKPHIGDWGLFLSSWSLCFPSEKWVPPAPAKPKRNRARPGPARLSASATPPASTEQDEQGISARAWARPMSSSDREGLGLAVEDPPPGLSRPCLQQLPPVVSRAGGPSWGRPVPRGHLGPRTRGLTLTEPRAGTPRAHHTSRSAHSQSASLQPSAQFTLLGNSRDPRD